MTAPTTVCTLFDRLHPEPSWDSWRVFLRAAYGVPLTGSQVVTFQKHTGRVAPRPGGYSTAAAIVGVRSGKTTTAGVILAGSALDAPSGQVALAVSQDSRASVRVLLKSARAPFDVPALRSRVERDTGDVIELRRAGSVVAMPCTGVASRGLTAAVVVLDELAHFHNSEGRDLADEVLRVARTRTLTTLGRNFIFTSPGKSSGATYQLWKTHYEVEGSSTLLWNASAQDMNSTLDPERLASIIAEDPEGSEAEIFGRFRAGVSSLFLDEALDAVVDRGVRSRPWESRFIYRAFADMSGGSGGDAASLAVAHREGDVAVLDCLRHFPPPFNPSVVLGEMRATLDAYHLGEVTADRYAAGLQVDFFKRANITKRDSPRDRSALYGALLPLVNSGRVRLLDHELLLRELRGLERHAGATRDRIDHARGAHDDASNAASGALTLVVDAPTLKYRLEWIPGVGFEQTDQHGIDAQGREWRDGNPWTGVFPIPGDIKGRALCYRDGCRVNPNQ